MYLIQINFVFFQYVKFFFKQLICFLFFVNHINLNTIKLKIKNENL